MSTVSTVIFVTIALLAVGTVAWIVLQDAFVRVQPGDMGLVLLRGRPQDRVLPPGMHVALRFGRDIVIYPSVELAYLVTGEPELSRTAEDRLNYLDPPQQLPLGDRAIATLQYTVRFLIAPESLPSVHDRFGVAGIRGVVRDQSRYALLAALGRADVSIADVFGESRTALEVRVAEALSESLSACGLRLTMFNLRDVDLAETGDVIQSKLRAAEELRREEARAAVRMSRAQQEAKLLEAFAGKLSAETIEYLRIQVLRELVERWDGKVLLSPGMSAVGDLMHPKPGPESHAASAPHEESPDAATDAPTAG